MAKNHDKKWARCLYCDASIAGDDAHVAALHDPYCPHGKSLSKLSRYQKAYGDEPPTFPPEGMAPTISFDRCNAGHWFVLGHGYCAVCRLDGLRNQCEANMKQAQTNDSDWATGYASAMESVLTHLSPVCDHPVVMDRKCRICGALGIVVERQEQK